jgi:hypothetical protein
MKLAHQFSTDTVESTEGIKKTISFGFSKNTEEMMFAMFTKNIYSNPIGSVVREITSNCFDSHKEANINEPVILRLIKENNQHYICFIDKGVGMSVDRVCNIYAEYFNSTKRDDNNQIGGFGIGGKTPLAYGDSFFLITNFDGVQYIYCIYKGEKKPMIDLLSEEPTTEHNGTTVKVPIKTTDIYNFEREINRQLYYFENVIFEGFSGSVENNYTIYYGKNFMYRGIDYTHRMHICLGQVAYPIDYAALGLNEGDFNVPVALKFTIGEINVTASRETLDYNDETKKLIKKKLEAVRNELKEMMLVQYKNISSLGEYYEIKKEFGKLTIDKEKGLFIHLSNVVKSDDLIYPKLSDIKIPSSDDLTEMLITVKLMGRKKKKDPTWGEDMLTMSNWKNIYSIGEGEKKNRRTQSWLKLQHEYYYLISPKEEMLTQPVSKEMLAKLVYSGVALTNPSKEVLNQINLLFQEGLDYIQKNSTDYKNVVVPSDFVMQRNNLIGTALLEKQIKVKHLYSSSYSTRRKTTLKNLLEFKGTLVYATRENEHELRQSLMSLESLKMITENKIFNLFGYDESIKFIIISKGLMPLMKHVKNSIPYTEVYNRFIFKKREAIIKSLENEQFLKRYGAINDLFFNKALTSVDKKLKVHTDALTKKRNKALESKIKSAYVDYDVLKIDLKKISSGMESSFAYVESQQKKNTMMGYVNISRWEDVTKNAELMKLINLVYVK